MQRSLVIFLFLPLSFYLVVTEKQKGVFKSFFMIFAYILILLFMGFTEYKKSGLFYFTPHTQGHAHWHYVSHKLNAKKFKLTNEESLQKKHEDLEIWKKENKINLNNIKDKRKVLDYKKNYFLENLKKNIFEYTKLHLYKCFQFFIIDIHYYKDKSLKWWKKSDFKKNLTLKIFYSLLVYLVCFFGLINLLSSSKDNKKLAFFIILIAFYFSVVVGWTGIPRYNLANLIFLSIYFGFGVKFLYDKYNNFRLTK